MSTCVTPNTESTTITQHIQHNLPSILFVSMSTLIDQPQHYVKSKPLKMIWTVTPSVVNKVASMTINDMRSQLHDKQQSIYDAYTTRYETIHRTKQLPFNEHFDSQPVHAVVSHGYVLGAILYDYTQPIVKQLYDYTTSKPNNNNTITQPVVTATSNNAISSQQSIHPAQFPSATTSSTSQQQQAQQLQHAKKKSSIFSCCGCGTAEHD